MEKSNSRKLQAKVDKFLDNTITKFYKESKKGDYLVSTDDLNIDYYIRHQIEIILRLRMKRCVDALTIHYFTKNDPHKAKKWAEYAEDEMCHDDMFAADLYKLGLSKEDIYNTEPFLATKLLQGYFYYALEHENMPLANLCSSYFIEYTSKKTQPSWLSNVEKHIGADKTKGARAHLNHDIEDNHSQFVWDFIYSFIEDDPKAETRIENYLTDIYKLFLMYFNELNEYLNKIESKKRVDD